MRGTGFPLMKPVEKDYGIKSLARFRKLTVRLAVLGGSDVLALPGRVDLPARYATERTE